MASVSNLKGKGGEGQYGWLNAREKDDDPLFRPLVKELKEVAERIAAQIKLAERTHVAHAVG